jgi:hypothetical protein
VDAPLDPPAGVPAPGSPDDAGAAPSDAAERPPVPRRLKLVVALEPDGAAGRAVLGVAAEGCDPELRVVPASGLVEALAEVPALLAAAEARWREHPRYPTASAPPRRPAAPAATGRSAGDAGRARVPAAPTEASPEAPPTETANQLPLFG